MLVVPQSEGTYIGCLDGALIHFLSNNEVTVHLYLFYSFVINRISSNRIV